MTYLQLDRHATPTSEWDRKTMAPAPLSPIRIARDYWDQLGGFRSSRLPLRFVPGFSFLWLVQRVAYAWGWSAGANASGNAGGG